MAARVSMIFGLFVFAISLLPQMTWAGSSQITNDRLYIPRLDVDGYGPSELVFRVEFDTNYIFILEEMVAASTATENSGVFDPETLSFQLDEVILDTGEHYVATMNLVTQDVNVIFSLGEAELLNPEDFAAQPSAEAVALYGAQCANCHGANGEGISAPALIECPRCGDAGGLADYIMNTMPLGNTAICDEICAATMANLIAVKFNPKNDAMVGQTIGFIELLGPDSSLRKISSQLVSRLPTSNENQLVLSQGDSGLRQVIGSMMEEDAFYDRLSEIFNDYFLTDKYLSSNGSEAAINLLNNDDYPQKRWFDPGVDNRTETYDTLRKRANDGVARAPLELINYIVRNNRPFTELVTAPYMMMNPYSARSYGVDPGIFQNVNDEDEWIPVTMNNIPHSGMLTSTMFLNRYPTSNTNRNRGRSRVIFDLFLDTDILAIEGVRPGNAVDVTTPIPTINNPECSKCHTIMDPVASSFQNWDYKGRYLPARLNRGWHSDMEARGFNGKLMPLAGNVDSSVAWLGNEIAVDPRFPKAMLRMIVNGFSGKEPLRSPSEGASQAEFDAYIAERSILNDIQQAFEVDNYNLKTMIQEFMLSPYYRAGGLTADANTLAHDNTGSTALLTPEQLDRKIESLLGFEWRGDMDNYHKNTENNYASQLGYQFQQIYGGIDSDDIIDRLTTPNGLMTSMQLRMSNELACYAVPQDFLQRKSSRRLFPFVDQTLSPHDNYGRIVESNLHYIRQNIQHLHSYLLAEDLPLGADELLITEELFMSVLNKGRLQIENSDAKWRDERLASYCDRNTDLSGNELTEDQRIQSDPDYLIRSWMSVIAYLMSDYRFFYE